MSERDGKRTGKVYFTRGRARDGSSSSGGEEEDSSQYQDCPQQLPEPLPAIPEEASQAVIFGAEQQHQYEAGQASASTTVSQALPHQGGE